MLSAKRRELIVQLLDKAGAVKTTELCEKLKVSDMTIRRDLERLEKEGLLKRVHGGAIINKEALSTSLDARMALHQKEKESIGTKAAEMIEDGDTIILDSGSTTLQIARRIGNNRNLNVVTNAINVAAELANKRGINVILTGGILRDVTLSLVGSIAEHTLKEFKVNKTFLAMEGVSVEAGLTNSLMEVPIKRIMIQMAKEVILVADHSKIGKVVFAYVAPITAVHKFITDSGASPDDIKAIQAKGIEVIIAE
ncbi:MAG: DeoR/GlpR family DNA-binding transcription regulator [bacterium]